GWLAPRDSSPDQNPSIRTKARRLASTTAQTAHSSGAPATTPAPQTEQHSARKGFCRLKPALHSSPQHHNMHDIICTFCGGPCIRKKSTEHFWHSPLFLASGV